MKLIKKKLNGIDTHYLQVKKYKYVLIGFSFYNQIDIEHYNERHLIPSLLENHNKIYGSSEKLNIAMDMLYGADILTGTYQRGFLFANQFFLKMVNPKYLNQADDILDQAFKLLYDVVYKPKTYAGMLTKKAVNDKVKEAKDALNTIKQDKSTYAYYRFLKRVSSGALPSFFPYEDYLSSMNQDSFSQTYQKMIEEDLLKIMVVGDFDDQEMDDIIQSHFTKKVQSLDLSHIALNQGIAFKSKRVRWIETDDVSISRIYLGFHLPIKRHSRQEMVSELLNLIVGGDAQSQLFLRVREQSQLVYMIYSAYLSEIDLFMIHFETEAKDEDQAIQLSLQTIEQVKLGNFSDQALVLAKNSLIKTYRSITDKIFGLVKLHMNEDVMTQKAFNLQDRIRTIQSIKKEEIIGLASQLKLSHEYRFVKGDDHA